MATTPTPQPGILDQLKQTGNSLWDAVKSRYLAGPPQGAPSAGPGSVLDDRNQQIRSLAPAAPQPLVQGAPFTPQPSPMDLVHPAPYGTRPGEKLIDVTEYQKPLGGLSGVKRSK
jgi:hypothetical protein